MTPPTTRLTMAQALVRYLAAQHVARDGRENPFFAGAWGIFGHGNVAGLGQALEQYAPQLRYYQSRNEQAQVLASVAYAKHRNRLATFACASSIGPGATNMITGAAVATINRIPGAAAGRRYLRRAHPGAGFAAAWKTSIVKTSASTIASSRSRAIGIASTAPSS